MMNVVIKCGDTAFLEDETAEVCCILRDIAKKIEQGHYGGPVYDINENNVGEWIYCPPNTDEAEE